MKASFHNIFTGNYSVKASHLGHTARRIASTAAAAGIMLLQPAAAIGNATAQYTAQALPAVGAPTASQYFASTGKTVEGQFLSTFNYYGLDLIGYPVSSEQVENGETVQYFQRVRMELHPELTGKGYPVLLTRLGTEMTQGEQFSKVASFASTSSHAYYSQTGHSLGGGFYTYWKQNGGVSLFGYPISEEFSQDGYTVQWFERARFEYHADLAASGHAIQLSLLGSLAYAPQSDRTATQSSANATIQSVQAPAPAVQPANLANTVNLSDKESYLLQAINDQRTAAGLSPVKLNATVTAIARSRSNDMAARNYFSHTTPEGKQFLDMLSSDHVDYKYGGEILARNNYPDDQAAQVAIQSYLNSAPHKAIILDGRFNYAGIGHAVDADGMEYFTVIFIQQ